MTKPRLTYFNAPASRGEECRLALHIAGVDFEDVRLDRAGWAALKPNTPFGQLPTYEVPGRPVLAQSNAILAFVGGTHGLHPTDAFEAARHLGMMEAVEDLRALIDPSMSMEDPEAKKRAREELANDDIPAWAGYVSRQIEGPFFAGAKLHVVDLKIYMVLNWILSGKLDHIPPTIFDAFPKLKGVHAAVKDHAGVRSWYART